MPFKKGNQLAAKEAHIKRGIHTAIRLSTKERYQWESMAKLLGLDLSVFIRITVNKRINQ